MSSTMIRTPNGMMAEDDILALFDQVGFKPPPGASTEQALLVLMQEVQRQAEEERAGKRRARGRTAELPTPPTAAAAAAVLQSEFGAAVEPIHPCGCEIKGVDIASMGGQLPPKLAGAVEVLMAEHGFALFRGQGTPQNESNVAGTYLSAEQQCALSECFGAGALHSTHGVHPEAPCRDVFRLSNHPDHGFNSVGPEWHNDGSFCRDVFGHVVYHIVKAPSGAGDTEFAHLGNAFDQLGADVQARLRRCASVNSNSGAVHPMAHNHPVSGRPSLYLHLGMTGAILEKLSGGGGEGGSGSLGGGGGGGGGEAAKSTAGADPRFGDGSTPADLPKPVVGGPVAQAPDLRAWRPADMEQFFCAYSELLDSPEVRYSHSWREGDVVVVDNLAVAHKAAPGAHTMDAGLRILHRTTVLSSLGTFDPPPELGMPVELPTTGKCPFEEGAGWFEGYVGFRWGAWDSRATPH